MHNKCIRCQRPFYTAGHSERVSDLAQMICGEMGITGECQNDIHVAAHLHDIGKIGIPDAVLNKPERADG